MEAKFGKFFDSVGTFFTGGDHLPWCDPDVIAVFYKSNPGNSNNTKKQRDGELIALLGRVKSLGCEREVAETENGTSDELRSESIMRMSWALVHSKRPEDVQRGIAMLEASLPRSNSPLKVREELYLLAVGFYRSGDYLRSRQLVERALEIAPDWRQALTLKKAIEDKITKDGVIGIGIAATAVGLLAGGIAAALSTRKK